MSSAVECPACERQFRIAEPTQDGLIRCLDCGFQFSIASAMVQPQARSASQRSSTEVPLPKPRFSRRAAQPPPSTESRNVQLARPAGQENGSKPSASISTVSTTSASVSSRSRRSSNSRWLYMVALSISGVALLLLVIFGLLPKDSQPPADGAVPVADATKEKNGSQSLVAQENPQPQKSTGSNRQSPGTDHSAAAQHSKGEPGRTENAVIQPNGQGDPQTASMATDTDKQSNAAEPNLPAVRMPTVSVETMDSIKRLGEQCRDHGWYPETVEQYRQLQELAGQVTQAARIEEDPSVEKGLRVMLADASVSIVQELHETDWPSSEKVTSINQMALQQARAPGLGVFAFGSVVQPPAMAPQINGQDTVVMQLVGTDQQVILPVSKGLDRMTPNSQWLVVGLDEGKRVQLSGPQANPDQKAIVIFAVFLVKKPAD